MEVVGGGAVLRLVHTSGDHGWPILILILILIMILIMILAHRCVGGEQAPRVALLVTTDTARAAARITVRITAGRKGKELWPRLSVRQHQRSLRIVGLPLQHVR